MFLMVPIKTAPSQTEVALEATFSIPAAVMTLKYVHKPSGSFSFKRERELNCGPDDGLNVTIHFQQTEHREKNEETFWNFLSDALYGGQLPRYKALASSRGHACVGAFCRQPVRNCWWPEVRILWPWSSLQMTATLASTL